MPAQALDCLQQVLGCAPEAMRFTAIGQDQSFTQSRIYRVTGQGDASAIMKCAPETLQARQNFAAANAAEVEFYQGYPGHPAPYSHFADSDPKTGHSILVLEDLGDVGSNFLHGLDPADAGRVVMSLAQFHAAHWGKTPEPKGQDFDFAALWQHYPARLSEVLPDFPLPDRIRALGDALAADGATAFDRLFRKGPLTQAHGDLQADNILWLGNSPKFIDWQMTRPAKGVSDLGYFLISSLTPTERRRNEADMLTLYYMGLQQAGVTGYSRVECQADYILSAAAKLRMSVVATMLGADQLSAHKRAWRQADLERLDAFLGDFEGNLESITI